MALYLVYFLVSYSVCAIPFGVLFAKLLNKNDLRTVGSGNIGATNALRTGGKLLGILTLLADVFKGYVFVYVGPYFFPDYFGLNDIYIYLLALICVLGHVFSYSIIGLIAYFINILIFKCESNFKRSGGKGVATALGTLFALNPSVGYICIFLWGGGYIMTRTSGISAVLSFFTLPIVLCFLDLGSFGFKIYTVILSVIIISTHVGNIRRYFKF